MLPKKLFIVLATLFLIGGTTSIAGSQAQSSQAFEPVCYADTVLFDGKIVTVDKSFSISQAVAVRDGKFMAVGNDK